MLEPQRADDERERLELLRSLEIFDTPPEPSFDDIVRLAAQLCATPTALITILDERRQWFKARVGFGREETPREQSFCAHAIEARSALIVHDASSDPRFARNPLVTENPGIRFYAGIPVSVGRGPPIGTLCVIDTVPRELTVEQMGALEMLARQVGSELELRRALATHEARAARAGEGSAQRSVSDDLVAGRYRLLRVLGRGGMGIVASARDVIAGDEVAIKFLLPDAVAHAEARERFVREARALARIESDHVARIRDVGSLANGAPFIVMELLRGSDLGSKLVDGALPIIEAVTLVRDACVGVEAAHAVGILHRDLKPTNLFVAERHDAPPCVKVVDFGIARMAEVTPLEAGLTRRDELVGTPEYMSPEQLSEPDTCDARADVWSMGVVLYELLTGALPFPGSSTSVVFAQQLHGVAPRVDALRREIPAALADVVARCLRMDASTRYASMRELRAALEPSSHRASTSSDS